MRRDAFSDYHPWVNFAFFLFVVLVTIFHLHPAYLAVSLLSAALYWLCLRGRRGLRHFLWLIPMALFTAVLNPLFNHSGATILTYLPGGNPLTAESIWYGLAAGAMFVAVICWFLCIHQVITTEKILFLFGRVIPALSQILAMALAFVPRFTGKLRQVRDAQMTCGREVSGGGLMTRLRRGMSVLSVTVTWALENAVDTADAMGFRGYGLRGRTSFSLYRFDRRDALAVCYLCLTAGAMLLPMARGAGGYRYFPTLQLSSDSPALEGCALAAYTLLSLFPVITHLLEEWKWRSLN